MKVLLTKAVPKLGIPGDTKDVKDGYARNYLLPQGLAVLTIDPKAKEIRASLVAARTQAEVARQDAQGKAKDWAGKRITITAEATSDGTLFGAVTDRDVARELSLEQKFVKFQPVKTVGSYEAIIDIGAGVDARVNVEVKAAQSKKK